MLLSESASAGVFEQAIRDVEAEGAVDSIADLVAWPGYRRRLRRRIHDWTVSERHRADDRTTEEHESVETPEWAVFRRYRQLLTDLDAEDQAGLSVWASIRLRERNARASASDDDHLVFLDFEGSARPQWRVLSDVLERPRSVDVTLAYQDDPAMAEVYLATASTRERLLKAGLVETPLPSAPSRPPGLQAVDELLFRDSGSRAARIETSKGLAVWGGPQGEDFGRLVAREVRRLMDQAVDPDDVLIVFPQWSDQAEVVCEVLHKAGLPIHDASPRPLNVEPSIAALLQAARLPLEDWETELVVRFIRNGQVRPDWEDLDTMDLAATASTVRDTPVFRGSRQILSALERAMARNEKDERETLATARLRRAHRIMELLIETVGTLDQPRSWSEHSLALRQAATTLGLGTRDGRALETLWDALEDRGEVLEKLGLGREATVWATFVDNLEGLTAEAPLPQSGAPAGSIRTALIDEIEGCRASHVLLVGLIEGSFPRRSAVQRFLTLRPGEEPSLAARSDYASEMLRFLQALGAAERGALLFYPTTDAKGQPLLRAGFLDDLLGTLSSSAESACHQAYARFHPALLDREDLAVAPADVRVLASALAGEQNQMTKLRKLARDPAHRGVLEGVAAALSALEHRRRGTPFSRFEGLIGDEAAVAKIAGDFDAKYTFSPSQLETYLNCPFQFFSRHVLHLKPVVERDELDEDSTERGSRLHDILEEFEKSKLAEHGDLSDEHLLVAAIDKVLAPELMDLSELDLGLRQIEHGQIQRIVAQYSQQREKYESEAPSTPVPKWFEYGFGEKEKEFTVSNGAESIKLEGRIDRIDVVETEVGPRFRVIDYKSGNPPSSKDVTEGRMLQLPLYAMAVERLLYAREDVGLLDVGYWGLKEKGYKPIVFQEWEEVRQTLVERVFNVISLLRKGEFVVAPRKEGCEAYCEYRSVCRIRQVRAAGKSREVESPVSDSKAAGGRKPRSPRKPKPPADSQASQT